MTTYFEINRLTRKINKYTGSYRQDIAIRSSTVQRYTSFKDGSIDIHLNPTRKNDKCDGYVMHFSNEGLKEFIEYLCSEGLLND